MQIMNSELSRSASSISRFVWCLCSIVLLGCDAANEEVNKEGQPTILGDWSQISPLERGPTETNWFSFKSNGTFQWKRFVIDEGRAETPSMTGTWIKKSDVIHCTVVETEKPTLMPSNSFDVQIIELSDSDMTLRDMRYDDKIFKIGGLTFLKRVR